MDSIRNNLLLCILIILKLFSGTLAQIFPKPTDAIQKSVICVVDNGLNNIKELPVECTSLASYSSNKKTDPDAIEVLRKDRKLQYLLIVDSFDFHAILDYVTTDQITSFISQINDLIIKFRADGVLFTRLNSEYNDAFHGYPDGPYPKGLIQVFDALRKKNNGLLIGYLLTATEDALKTDFSYPFMNTHVDFFVADTAKYNDCVHKDHQAEMANIAPLKEITNTLDMMKKYKITEDKLIFIIRIVVRDTALGAASNDDDTSYADMCSENHKFSEDRKFCTETLTNFFLKGKVISDRKLKGTVIYAIDYDDFAPNCGTNKFPAMQSIKAGMDGKPEPKAITGEQNWAILARDRAPK